jgi:CDGSH-type Zn-finger protein
MLRYQKMKDQTMKDAIVPIKVELECNKKYFWCSCGKSSRDPFCDGSHGGSEFRSKPFSVQENAAFLLCMCKNTKNPPYCDGSHQSCSAQLLS